jgi:predicted Zn-dependent protease
LITRGDKEAAAAKNIRKREIAIDQLMVHVREMIGAKIPTINGLIVAGDSIEAAKEVLLNAESKFPNEAAIKYNLACYFCQTGDIQKARNYLQKVFEIDLNWRMAALEDEDLKVMWESL